MTNCGLLITQFVMYLCRYLTYNYVKFIMYNNFILLPFHDLEVIT